MPTTKTKRIQRDAPEKRYCFVFAHPSGEAKTTGTATTKAKDKATKANKAN